MTKFATQYVKGCAACQTCKVNSHPTKPGLVPIPHSGNSRPFQTITIDYITDLPPSKGPGDQVFTAIQVVVDHDVSKAIVLSPCTKEISAEGALDLLFRDIYSKYRFPSKIISDRGPQFIAKSFRELHKYIGTQSALSVAYHPQTDGQTERTNRELGLALRIYCGNAPDQWSSLLSAFEYAHNQSVHSVTGKTPFELLYGYQPEGLGNVKINSKHPATEERLRQLHRDRKYHRCSQQGSSPNDEKIACWRSQIQEGRQSPSRGNQPETSISVQETSAQETGFFRSSGSHRTGGLSPQTP